MRRHFRLPPRGRSGPWLVALAVGLLLAIQPIWLDNVAIAVAGGLGLTFVAAARWQLRWLPVVVVVLCGIVLRLSVMHHVASDVADVTEVAIGTMLYGGDPYGIGYVVSRPVGAPFPYGPIALLWYLPMMRDPATLEFLVSVGLMLYFGVRAGKGRPIGLAVFALAPPLVMAAMNGSNDTSAGLIILAALAVSATRPVAGAILLAVAVAFKPYAIAWLPPLVMWSGLQSLVVFVGASIIAWSPVLFVWGPGSYLKSLAMAQETHLREPYWSLGSILASIVPGAEPRALETVRYFISGAVAFLGGRRVHSIDGVIAVGTLAFVIAQFGGYFGSYVYIAAIAPVLCWRVDDWLRMGLPELVRAYGEVPEVARRLRRPALGTVARRAEPAPARLLHVGPSQRARSRPTRNPTG
jgi:hypothetical protein